MVGVLITPGRILGGLYELPSIDCRIAGCIVALTLTLGCILFGWLEDKIGTTFNMLIAWGGLAIVSLYFYATLSKDISIDLLYIHCAIFGLFTGAIATLPIVGTRAFPPKIRYSGISFSHNLAYAIFSAITPTLTLYLLNPAHILGENAYLGAGIYISFVAILGVMVGFIPLAKQGWQETTK